MPHQENLFPGDTLFDRLARAVCRAGTLPLKELYEAWETAKRVRRRFKGGRVVDLACGHGLLAHVMLLLDRDSESALAVDRRIPENADRLANALAETWPRLGRQVRFLEADIDEVTAGPGDLVVSAHACGALTDRILEKSVAAAARVAVLPCCHDAAACRTCGLEKWMDVSMAIDAARVFRLQSAGYRVTAQSIPSEITPKNRLIIAEPVGLTVP